MYTKGASVEPGPSNNINVLAAIAKDTTILERIESLTTALYETKGALDSAKVKLMGWPCDAGQADKPETVEQHLEHLRDLVIDVRDSAMALRNRIG